MGTGRKESLSGILFSHGKRREVQHQDQVLAQVEKAVAERSLWGVT